MAKIFVTGASGCIGASLVKKLVRQGHKINILIPKGTWHPFLDNLKLKIFYGDVRNKKDIEKAMKNCKYVYHVAGIVSYNLIANWKVFSVNFYGTKNILEIAKKLKVKKIVVTASTAGIGIPENSDKPLNENAPFNPKYKKIAYMYSKHLAIQECKQYARQGLNVSILSPTTVYGQGDITMHIGNLIKRIKQGQIKTSPPGGNSVLSVDDVVDAHLLVMKKGKKGENYIFANEALSYYNMYNKIAKILNVKPIKRIKPGWYLPFLKFFLTINEIILFIFNKKSKTSPTSINFLFRFRYFDSTKARKELGWKPKQIFEQAIIQAIEFYDKHNML